MASIVPAVLANDIEQYNQDLERALLLSDRVQIDIADGDFAPSQTINLVQAHWPDGVEADIHLMQRNPLDEIETAIALRPHLILFHVESDGDIGALLDECSSVGQSGGVVFLAETPIEGHEDLIEKSDHVLLFSGSLGEYGGETDMSVLDKIPAIRSIKLEIEIGIDGGINQDNAKIISEAGVDILNVGSAIQNADNPQAAYDTLLAETEGI